MTGILITAGENPLSDHGRAGSFFTECRGLHESRREISGGMCLSAFSRSALDEGLHVSSGNADIFALGLPVYRGYHGTAALSRLIGDLENISLRHAVQDCDGQFCLVVRDRNGARTRIVTDHAGIMNMYAYRAGERLAISSSSMALSRSLPVTPEPLAVAQFLRCGNVYGAATIYAEITLLKPASLYTFEAGEEGVREEREGYWHPPTEIRDDDSFEESRDSLMRALVEGIQALPGEGAISDLTAGFDSRLILALLSRFRPMRDIEIFVFGPETSREAGLVEGYCRDLGLKKNRLALPHDWDEQVGDYVDKSLAITDGEENVFVYAPILWAQEHKARSHGFSINGLGGELYRDFWWIQELYPSKRPANLDRLIRMRVLQYEYEDSIFSEAWKRRMTAMRGILRKEFLGSIHDMDGENTYNTLQIDNLYLRQKMWRWAGRTISSSSQVIGMLTPLAMKRSIDAALSMPPHYKRNGRMVKSIVEELSPELSRLKMLNGAPCRNMTVRNFPEFFPLAVDYGRRGVRKIVQKLFNRTIMVDRTISYPQAAFFTALFEQPAFRDAFRYDALLTKELFHPGAYSKFYEDAVQGRSHYYHQLGTLLTLEMRMRSDKVRRGVEAR